MYPATDRFQYGYDRDSHALYRNNLVNTAFGELYHASGAGNGYDNLNQLSGFLRGVLSASGGGGSPLDTVSTPSNTVTWTPDALGNFSSGREKRDIVNFGFMVCKSSNPRLPSGTLRASQVPSGRRDLPVAPSPKQLRPLLCAPLTGVP